jgi:enoyl-[acyl-carrier protein] reductase III
LVTGGTRGIGRAISLRLARERPQAIVAAYCLDHDAARKTVAELQSLGVQAEALATNVGDPVLLEKLFRHVEDKYGRLDVFVSNAARASFAPAMELSTRVFARMMELNAQAFLVGSQLAARLMKKNGGGNIIGVSSLGSLRCAPHYAGLGSSKAALESLARYLACELAPDNINVNVVSGGYIDTESMKMNPERDRLVAHVLSRTPAARLGTAEDLAEVVGFLCTPASGWIRGQVLVADGGFSLTM